MDIIKKKRERFKKRLVNDKNCQCACEQYKNLSEEEKNKEQIYGRKPYKNLPEDEK